ncbi:cytochrome P450 [Marasmius fiardii PR-910]|nr:cytochrome P450 [Marasmius fiardii PR-910]
MLHDDGGHSQDTHIDSLIRETAASMYGGGTDTVYSLFLSFMLAMVCFPEYQAKVQQEIDTVIGSGRLPEPGDRNSLPYCEAILKEVARWQPPAPVGVPHYINTEDEYRGYRIPRNTAVLSNVWSIFHDETVYPEPYAFNPERWLARLEDGRVVVNSNTPDITPAFGFGRRLCPGRHFALSALFVNIASVLAAYDLLKPIDKSTGNIIEPSMEFLDLVQRRPAPFKCVIRPRTEKHATLVRRANEGL